MIHWSYKGKIQGLIAEVALSKRVKDIFARENGVLQEFLDGILPIAL